MNAITQASLPAITADLFADFTNWIDLAPTTVKTYKNALKQFALYLNAHAITQPGRDDIRQYRDDLLTQGKQVTTVRNYLHALQAFFNWTADKGYYPNIAQHITLPKLSDDHKRDALTKAEALDVMQTIERDGNRKTLDAADQTKDTAGRQQRAEEQAARMRAMYLVCVCAGLRCIEISRANVKDLIHRNGKAYLNVYGKGRSAADQRKALPAEAAEALAEYLAIRKNPEGSAPLFAATGNRNHGGRIAATTVSTMLKRELQAAGIDDPKVTAHSLRHTAGTAAMETTKNIYTVQKFMRHSNPAVTEVYLHGDDLKQDADTADKVYTYLFKPAKAKKIYRRKCAGRI